MERNFQQSRSMKKICASSENISSDTLRRSSAKIEPYILGHHLDYSLYLNMFKFEFPKFQNFYNSKLVMTETHKARQNKVAKHIVSCDNTVFKKNSCGKSINYESDNIIKGFENLHVNDDSKNVSSKNDANKVECRNKLQKSSSDDKEDENNNDNVTINGSKDNCKANKCLPLNIRDVEKIEQKHEDSYDSDDCNNVDDPDLIARGPMRPDYQHQRRVEPYLFFYQNNCTPIEDIEKRAEEIMKNKDYSEKLNPCLDQLSSSLNYQNELSIGAIDLDRTEENGFYSGDLSSDTKLSSIVFPNMGHEEIAKYMKHKGYQSVSTICSDTGNSSILSPRSTLSDSPRSFVSRSNSRTSSRAQSPGSVTNSSGSPQMPFNINGSPLGSPQVAPTYRVSQALLSSSSSNQSSPSNQSYSDVSSPLNHQTSPNFQLEDQFSEILCSGDSSGTFNETDELQLIDQVIKDQDIKDQVIKNDERNMLKNLKKSEVTHNIPHCSSSYNNLKHEYLASNTQSEPIRLVQTSNLNNRTSYANMCISAGKEVNSPNYCMPNKCVPPNLYPHSFSNQTCYNTNIKNPQIDDVSKYRDNFSNTVVNNNGRSVKIEQNSSQKMFHATSNEENRASSSTYEFNNFRVPKTVPSSSIPPRRNRSTSEDDLWNSLNLPPVSASMRLKQELNIEEVKRAFRSLMKMPIEKLRIPDAERDTQLTCFLSNPEEFKKNMAYLVPLVDRLDNATLELRNNKGKNALYFAAINYPEMSYIFGYLAAVMMYKGIDINQKLDLYNNTVLHCIAANGDSHKDVLVEMLSLLKKDSAFDIDSPNIYGETALYLAVREHLTHVKVEALATTRLLLENGANPKVKEYRNSDTVLHIAVSLHCDPALVKILLNADPTIVNERNYMGNTPLHLAAKVSTVDLEKQKDVCRLLIEAGGLIDIRNKQGKTPLSLVSLERKEIIKKILHRKL